MIKTIQKEEIPSEILTREVFESELDELIWMKDLTHVEAVVEFCEERGLEVESVVPLLGPDLLARIEEDFVGLRYLKARPTLPAEW